MPTRLTKSLQRLHHPRGYTHFTWASYAMGGRYATRKDQLAQNARCMGSAHMWGVLCSNAAQLEPANTTGQINSHHNHRCSCSRRTPAHHHRGTTRIAWSDDFRAPPVHVPTSRSYPARADVGTAWSLQYVRLYSHNTSIA